MSGYFIIKDVRVNFTLSDFVGCFYLLWLTSVVEVVETVPYNVIVCLSFGLGLWNIGCAPQSYEIRVSIMRADLLPRLEVGSYLSGIFI